MTATKWWRTEQQAHVTEDPGSFLGLPQPCMCVEALCPLHHSDITVSLTLEFLSVTCAFEDLGCLEVIETLHLTAKSLGPGCPDLSVL